MKPKCLPAGYVVFFSLFFFSCSSCLPPPTPPDACDNVMQRVRKGDGRIRKPVYIVLCDFSASMDDRSVHFVLKKAKEIYDRYYNEAFIKFYPITNASISPVFESGVTMITDSGSVSQSDLIAMKDCLDSQKRADRQMLEAALEKELTARPQATYIISSLQSAIGAIQVADPDRLNNNMIFILSDMLESGKSRWGSINLEKNMKEGLATLKAVADSSAGDASVGKNIKIKVGFYTQQIKEKDTLMSFWKLVFGQLGYSENVAFSSELAL